MISLMPPSRPMCWWTPAASVSIFLQVSFIFLISTLSSQTISSIRHLHAYILLMLQMNYCNQIFSPSLTSRWLHQTTFLIKFFILHYILGWFHLTLMFAFLFTSFPIFPTAFQGIFISTCNVDVRWFPFDIQRCELKFGSWTFDGWLLDLQMKEADVSGYMPNGEWDLLGKTACLGPGWQAVLLGNSVYTAAMQRCAWPKKT